MNSNIGLDSIHLGLGVVHLKSSKFESSKSSKFNSFVKRLGERQEALLFLEICLGPFLSWQVAMT